MTELYIALGIVGFLIVALLVFLKTRPDNFRIERRAQIGASGRVRLDQA
jgi:hypothetical protein